MKISLAERTGWRNRVPAALAVALLTFDACLALFALPPSLPRTALVAAVLLLGVGGGLVAALFHGARAPDRVSRLALGACFSVAIGGVGGFALSRTPGGLNAHAAALFVSASCALGALAWALAGGRIAPGHAWRQARARLAAARAWSPARWCANLALLALVVAAAAHLAWASARPASTTDLTEFYLLNAAGQLPDSSRMSMDGQEVRLLCGVANREHREAEYRIIVSIDGQVLLQSSAMRLAPGEETTALLKFTLPRDAPRPAIVDFTLRRNGSGYRHLRARLGDENQ